MTVLGSDAFGMKLHAVDGKRLVHDAHHKPVAGFGIYFQCGRHACTFNHERMIARRFQGAVDAAEDSSTGMLISDTLPWIGAARTTLPPKNCPMA